MLACMRTPELTLLEFDPDHACAYRWHCARASSCCHRGYEIIERMARTGVEPDDQVRCHVHYTMQCDANCKQQDDSRQVLSSCHLFAILHQIDVQRRSKRTC